MRIKRGWRAKQRGAAALEFVIVLPVLMLLITGIIDLSLGFAANAVTGSAAREGVRAAALGANVAGAKAAALSQLSVMPGGNDPGTTVTVTCKTALGASCNIDDTTSDAGGSVKVQVKYVHTWILPGILGFGDTTNIVRSSEMRVEG